MSIARSDKGGRMIAHGYFWNVRNLHCAKGFLAFAEGVLCLRESLLWVRKREESSQPSRLHR